MRDMNKAIFAMAQERLDAIRAKKDLRVALHRAERAFPSLRLGQLIANACVAAAIKADLFTVSDVDLARALQDYTDTYKGRI